MPPERWQQIEELYHAALDRAPDERAAFLAEACAEDSDLRREVEELLRYDGAAESFIEENALVVAAQETIRQIWRGPRRSGGRPGADTSRLRNY
ncbi:MAG: hypothetical protein ACREEM_48095 [Blastocatellia bacterium]